MCQPQFNLGRCLERIGCTGSVNPNINSLQTLQKAFLLRIPFENLDIHLGREIKLDSKTIYKKIVMNNRGGFCYECNILFFDLLAALGYQVAYLSARMIKAALVGPEYDHMVLLVKLEHDYLVDVGNGQSFREPLRIDGTNSATSEGFTYRIGTHGKEHALYYRQPDEEWKPRFLVRLERRKQAEFSDMCHYHQTSASSPFTRHRMATIATQNGRVTLRDRRLSIADGITTQESSMQSECEYHGTLKRFFGIDLAAEDCTPPNNLLEN